MLVSDRSRMEVHYLRHATKSMGYVPTRRDRPGVGGCWNIYASDGEALAAKVGNPVRGAVHAQPLQVFSGPHARNRRCGGEPAPVLALTPASRS